VIPNFVDVAQLATVQMTTGFREEFGLEGKFLVTYAGNIGPAQGLESLLEAATLLADVPDVMVALIGDGSLAPVFQERIGDLGLRNVTMIPYQPFARVPEIYATSDLSIVAQAVATGADAVPSKLYRIMAAARPILAITAPDSDVARLVREADCGY